ncbi:uncharacterized protein [Ambystoma mexicanum]|uniref:uncharacterized protein n=1 Tax=Ambystoma mexicanum TaxID=8296 RepID=UPI0037E90F9B
MLASSTKPNSQIIILDDLNLGYQDKNDSKATGLENVLADFGLTQHVGEPTHIKGRTLDWVSDTNCALNVTSVSPCAWSDHHKIAFTINSSPLAVKPNLAPPTYTRNKKDITVEKLLPLILPLLNSASSTCSDPTALVDTYNHIMLNALNTIAPIKLRKQKPRLHLNSWFTPHLRDLRKEKRKAEAHWKSLPSLINKNNLTLVSLSYKEAILAAKKEEYNKRIIQAQSNTKELFKILKELESLVAPLDTCTPDSEWCANIQKALLDKIALLHSKINAKKSHLSDATPRPTKLPHPNIPSNHSVSHPSPSRK